MFQNNHGPNEVFLHFGNKWIKEQTLNINKSQRTNYKKFMAGKAIFTT